MVLVTGKKVSATKGVGTTVQITDKQALESALTWAKRERDEVSNQIDQLRREIHLMMTKQRLKDMGIIIVKG